MLELTVIEFSHFCISELPLPSESVDIIISDFPFGKKFKLGKDIKGLCRRWKGKLLSVFPKSLSHGAFNQNVL